MATWVRWDSVVKEEGVLKRAFECAAADRRKLQVAIPWKGAPDVLGRLHDEPPRSNFRVHGILEKVRDRSFWSDLEEDARNWCRGYAVCVSADGPLHGKGLQYRGAVCGCLLSG